MLKIELQGMEAVNALFDQMQSRIAAFGHEDLPTGLRDWEIEDMKRKYPEVETPDAVSAQTKIYPRSRTYAQTHHVPVTRRKPVASSMPRLKGVPSQRPILRPALYDMLTTRMSNLLGEKIKWR